VAAFSQQQFSGASKSSQFASTFGNAALKQHFAPVESGVAPIPVEQVVTLTPPPAPVRLSVEDELKSRFGTNVRSALGPGTVIEGKFSFDTPVRIDGTLKGEVVATSVLIVGEEGVVDASVQVGSLVVLGRVVGDVVAEDLVEIKSTGTLDGDISSERLMVEDGGVFRGRCNV
jgi:cytoskeletal protein CcmA (bactofilin family)